MLLSVPQRIAVTAAGDRRIMRRVKGQLGSCGDNGEDYKEEKGAYDGDGDFGDDTDDDGNADEEEEGMIVIVIVMMIMVTRGEGSE